VSSPESHALHDLVLAQLADGRPHSFDAITEALGYHLPDDPDEAEDLVDDALEELDRIATLDGETWIDLFAVLEGRWFTHRMSALEASAGVIPLMPDIDPALMAFGSDPPLADGSSGTIVFADSDPADGHEDLQEARAGGGLTGGGLLDGVTEGTVVGVRLRSGALEIRPEACDPTLTEGAAEALARTFSEMAEDDKDGVALADLALTWLIEDAEALRAPHEPLSDLLAAAGLEIRGDYVGRAGHHWMAPPERAFMLRRKMRETVYGFEECCHDALALANGAFGDWIEDVPPRQIARALSHGNVAEAFCASLIGASDELRETMLAMLLDFTEAPLAAARGGEAAGPHYVDAFAFECLGRSLDAEESARAALRADPSHQGAAELLAEYLDTRGDAAQALAVLRRGGAPDDDPQVERLTALAAGAAPEVGRNAPCPCGSGRKYKACCLGKPRVSDDQRFHWLYEKALTFARHPIRREAITHLAEHFVDASGSGAMPAIVAVEERRLSELGVFDDGLLEDFIDTRGVLLPPAEAELARSWIGRPLALFEVEESDPGEGLRLRDSLTGERVSVIERMGSHDLAVGDSVVARLLPDGDLVRLGGPVLKPTLQLRESLLELTSSDGVDACEWAEWLGWAEAPPRMVNAEGEDIVQALASAGVTGVQVNNR